jgi:putative transposon-encoded protein
MVRRMKAIITQIESTVTPSGNSGHVVVPKAWIGSYSQAKRKRD